MSYNNEVNMKNTLIKSLLVLSMVYCSASYSAITFEVKPSSTNVNNNNKKPQQKSNNNKNTIYFKYNKDNKDLNDVSKNDKNKSNANKRKQKDNSNTVDINTLKFKISGYATFCGAGVANNNVYYDGSNAPESIKITQGVNEKSIIKSDAQTKVDKDGVDLIAGEAAIKFNADGETDNFKYGALLEIQAEKEDIDIDKAIGYVQNDQAGKFRFGNFKGTDNDFVFSGQKLLLANFGIDGIITSQLDYATGCLNPRAPIGFANKATKFDYCSPDLAGFKFGFSYTPDAKHVGHDKRDRTIGSKSAGNNKIYAKGNGEEEAPCGRHNIALGIQYGKDFGNGWKVRSGFVFITERTQDITTNCYSGEINSNTKPEPKKIKLNNAQSWIASLEVTYNNLTIAGGYYNSGKSRLPRAEEYTKDEGQTTVIIPAFMCDKDGDAGYAWNIGAKLKITDKFALTGVYHSTSRKITKTEKATAKVFTMAVDYDINDNFALFGEMDILNSQSSPYACTIYNLNHKEDAKDALLSTHSLIVSAGMTISF